MKWKIELVVLIISWIGRVLQVKSLIDVDYLV